MSPKPTEFEFAIFVDQKILRFQVAMQHVLGMTKCEASKQLKHKRLHDIRIDLAVQAVEILLQILIAVLEDQREFLFTMQHIVKPLRRMAKSD